MRLTSFFSFFILIFLVFFKLPCEALFATAFIRNKQSALESLFPAKDRTLRDLHSDSTVAHEIADLRRSIKKKSIYDGEYTQKKVK